MGIAAVLGLVNRITTTSWTGSIEPQNGKGVFVGLKVGQPVTLKDEGAAYVVRVLDNARAARSYSQGHCAHLSTLTGESQSEIIRQAIDKILALGPDEVIRTVEMRTVERTAKRAGEAAVRAERAARRVQERAVRAARKAQERTEKAEQEDTTRSIDEMTIESAVEREAIQAEANHGQAPPHEMDDSHPVQLDRPVPPSPAHTWVNGGTNRWGGYWRAPRGTKMTI